MLRAQGAAPAAAAAAPTVTPAPGPRLQRACACGGTPGPTGECAACRRKRLAHGRGGVQTKLRVSTPGDVHEREADRIAAQVMRMPAGTTTGRDRVSISARQQQSGSVARQEAAEEEEEIREDELLSMQAAPGSHEIPSGFEADMPVGAGGRPLDAGLRSSFEHRFGHDFSRVRVHTDARAHGSARSIHARAYTLGQDIVFASGEYRPAERAGQALIAHELVHVLQQSGGGQSVMRACDCATIPGARDPSAAENTRLSSAFPRLVAGDWCVLAPKTATYNCIAWSVGDTSQWVWDQVDTHGDNDGTVSISDFDAYYMDMMGLTPSEHPSSNSQVALFAKGTDPTHAAPLNPNSPACGTVPFTSKLGSSVRISHDLYQLEGGTVYGDVVRYYDR